MKREFIINGKVKKLTKKEFKNLFLENIEENKDLFKDLKEKEEFTNVFSNFLDLITDLIYLGNITSEGLGVLKGFVEYAFLFMLKSVKDKPDMQDMLIKDVIVWSEVTKNFLETYSRPIVIFEDDKKSKQR